MKSIILIAPPAGGKGTQSDLICSKYNIPHISTGDLLRDEASKNTKEGNELKEQMRKGVLIKDEIIYDLIKKRLSLSDCDNGYVLDGFPRNLEQAYEYDKILSSINKELGYVILLDIPSDIASRRISGRISCPKCGRVYNSYFDEMKPKEENMCDICHIPLIKREDDNASTYEVRYKTYIEKTQPLIDYYTEKKVLYKVDTTVGVAKTFEKIEEIIRGV